MDSRGGPPLLGTGGPPPGLGAAPVDNSSTMATPTLQAPVPEGAIMAPPPDPATLESAYQERVYQQSLDKEEPFGEEPLDASSVEAEPAYQQPLYWEEPFAATSVETEPVYQQPTGELTVQDTPTTPPNTVGHGPAMPDTAAPGGNDATTAALDTTTDEDVAVVLGSFSGQEPAQITGEVERAAHFASISHFSGQGDIAAGEGRIVAVVGTVAPLALSQASP